MWLWKISDIYKTKEQIDLVMKKSTYLQANIDTFENIIRISNYTNPLLNYINFSSRYIYTQAKKQCLRS